MKTSLKLGKLKNYYNIIKNLKLHQPCVCLYLSLIPPPPPPSRLRSFPQQIDVFIDAFPYSLDAIKN